MEPEPALPDESLERIVQELTALGKGLVKEAQQLIIENQRIIEESRSPLMRGQSRLPSD